MDTAMREENTKINKMINIFLDGCEMLNWSVTLFWRNVYSSFSLTCM